MAKLDDFLIKKKETTPILDLSKTTANSKEELRRLLEKVPDFRIRPEKVLPETIKIKEKKFTFKSPKKTKKGKYSFMDPVPVEMKSLKLEDLVSVSIDWRMLTNLRPKSKVEENYFTRMLDLGKFQNKSRIQEKKEFQLDPQIKKTKNKSGVVEIKVVSCTECNEDFCNGKVCCKYGYDSFARVPEQLKTEKVTSPNLNTVTKRRTKKKSKPKGYMAKKYEKSSKKQESKSKKK